jgi:basic membrane protein A
VKKILALVLVALFLVVMVAACDSDNGGSGGESSDIKIALVGHGPASLQFDGSFNEGAWMGILQFLESQNLDVATSASWFQAHAPDDDARVDIMIDAIETWGADILVLPGFHFADSSYTAANLFPDVMFVAIDYAPNPGPTPANVVSITYAEEQSGFLAGYAAVMDGYRELGFMGGISLPAVVRFGHGYLEGAQYAANELGLSAGEVSVNYHYLGSFTPDPATTTMANAWYASGTEVIFVAAGLSWQSVAPAASSSNAWVIGVDTDQSLLPDIDVTMFLTSAMKALAVSVNDMLNEFNNGQFRGGSDLLFDATNDGVALPMANSKFTTFSQAQYDAIFAQLKNGTIKVSTAITPVLAEANLDLSLLDVNFIS